MVYDVYHTIPLNVVKNQLIRLLELEMVINKYVIFLGAENYRMVDFQGQVGRNVKEVATGKLRYFKSFPFL